MGLREVSPTDPRLSKRLQFGALLAVCAPGAALVDIVRAATGPRYQVVRGTEYDLWLEIAAEGGAWILASIVGAALGPLWRRRPVAALLAAACTLPLAAAQSIAADPHGPTPHRVRWLIVLFLSALIRAIVAWKHPKFAQEMKEGRLLARARRIGRAQRRAG